MYIIGIDYGHGETSAAILEIDNELYEKILALEKQDYSSSEVKSVSSEEMVTALGTSLASPLQAVLGDSLLLSSLKGNDNNNDSISDINAEWNVTAIRHLLYKSFYSLKDLKIKGDAKTIKSVLVYDWNKGKWEIGPNIQKIKLCISNLDYKDNQYARMAAYFKAPLISGKGKVNRSNDLHEIKPEQKKAFGLFIENVFKNIIESNTMIHENPCNYKLYVACPSEWDNAQIDEYIKFIHEKGIKCEEVVQESRAAYMAFRDTIIGNTINDKEEPGVLVIDFGSSTIDFTYFGGEKTINDGYQLGASKVEETIFDYLYEEEPTARSAFNKLKDALEGDELLAKTLLVFAIRYKKEQFYSDLADNGEAFFEDIQIKNLVSPVKNTGIIFTGADVFGFDNGGGCDKDKMETILSSYIKEVKDTFLDFKKKDGVGNINHVILTGGASKMDFVRELVEDEKIYNVHRYSAEEIKNGKENSLHIDDEPTYSISRGIAKYGTYRTLSEPIRKAIESRLSATWSNEEWLKQEIKNLISSVTKEVYYSYFCSIVDEWSKTNSLIKSEAENNLNELLESIYERILQDDPDNLLWKNIKLAKKHFMSGQRSIHALLRKLYDDIELGDKDNRDKIDSLMNEGLTKRVNDQVGSLFKKYMSIYFDDSNYQVSPNLPAFYNIKVIFNPDQKKELLIKLIENVCTNMAEGATQTEYTFNKDRESSFSFHASRSGLSPEIKRVLNNFCDEIDPDFDISAISTACRICVKKKFAEIKDLCEKEPYTLKV